MGEPPRLGSRQVRADLVRGELVNAYSRSRTFIGETGLGKTVAARVPKPSRRGDCSPAQYALRPLRRDAIGQRVGMKIGVITQTSPRTVLLGRLRDAVLFARRKVVPRGVSGDRQECPGGTFQVLHQHVAGSRVARSRR